MINDCKIIHFQKSIIHTRRTSIKSDLVSGDPLLLLGWPDELLAGDDWLCSPVLGDGPVKRRRPPTGIEGCGGGVKRAGGPICGENGAV